VDDVKELLSAAAGGDEAAWHALVRRYDSLLWSVARSFRLHDADAGDVVQTTWLKLVENLDRIVEPARLPGWLGTTVRRECIQILRRANRDRPAADVDLLAEVPDSAPPVDHAVLLAERDAALWRALGMLGERCRQLLRVLMASPAPGYAEVADALDMPIGSIGPTRQRCLGQLRKVMHDDVRLRTVRTESEAT
jgi:RNA polymerase sigma factor (sigma-70 family)